METVYKALLLFITTSCILLVVQIFYNVFLHPFRRIPGPPLARVTGTWSRVANFKGLRYDRIHQAHQVYGPVVRIGPNELSFADPKVVREIYNSDVFVKEPSFYFAKKVFHEEHLFSFREPEAHKQRRKLFSRGFSQAALNDFEPEISAKIETMLNKWSGMAKSGRSFNIQPWAYWLGFDTVYHLLFGVDPQSLANEKEHEVIKYLRAWRPTYIYKEYMPQMEKLGPYIPGPVGGYFRDVKAWKSYAVKLIRSTRDGNVSTPFLKTVLHGEKDGYLQRPLTDSELAEECMGGMFGGTGTTANTFIYILWATLQRPDIVAKLKTELKDAIPDKLEIPSYQVCAKLPYLQAVIDETLRLYPTIVATLPRVARQSTTVGGVAVPKGAVVGTQNYTLHRWAPAFPEPEKFEPDRWLGKDISETQKEAFVPFSVGPRRCIGINLAQMELTKVTAAFFRRFDATIDPTMKAEDMRLFDTFSASPVGAKLVLLVKEAQDKMDIPVLG